MSGRPSILVVDDSATARFALAAVLGSRFDVAMATNGRAALTAAAELKPDLILLDVVMPIMDGFEACRALRDGEATRGTPIILVTAQDEEWDVETGYASGCNDYVTKPVDRVELIAKIDSWLDVVTEREPA